MREEAPRLLEFRHGPAVVGTEFIEFGFHGLDGSKQLLLFLELFVDLFDEGGPSENQIGPNRI